MTKTIDALANALLGIEVARGWIDASNQHHATKHIDKYITETEAALARARAEQAKPVADARDGMRGAPCEVQDGDPSSPTHRQWLKARFVALDLIAGEPIVQVQGRMPWFATWASVRGITPPAAPAPKLDSAHESVAAKPKLEPCGVVESAVRGCGGYHVRVWPGQPAPRVGTELYTHPPTTQTPKLEPLTPAECSAIARSMPSAEVSTIWVQNLVRRIEAAHNARLGSK